VSSVISYVSATKSLWHETGSSGYVASNLQSDINEIQVEATAVQNPDIKTIVSAIVNLTGQGSVAKASSCNKNIYIVNLTACPLLDINHPVCNPSVFGDNFTFTFEANKPVVEYSCSLNNKQPSLCSKIFYTLYNINF